MNTHHSQWSGSAATHNRVVGCSQLPCENHWLKAEKVNLWSDALKEDIARGFRYFWSHRPGELERKRHDVR